MDNNEKIQLDDISFDDVIGGDGVDTVAVEEEIAPPQEDEKQIETSDEEDVLDDVEETEEEYDEEEYDEDESEEESSSSDSKPCPSSPPVPKATIVPNVLDPCLIVGIAISQALSSPLKEPASSKNISSPALPRTLSGLSLRDTPII